MFKIELLHCWVCALILFFLGSCFDKSDYKSEVIIPEALWQSKEAIVFSPEIFDTLQNYNIRVSISNSNKYRYSNLWLFVKSKSPDGFQHRDTIEIFLAEDNGKWLGKKQNEIWNLDFYYKKKVRFPKSGNYTFEIQHGMRELQVSGIEKIVFELEKNID